MAGWVPLYLDIYNTYLYIHTPVRYLCIYSTKGSTHPPHTYSKNVSLSPTYMEEEEEEEVIKMLKDLNLSRSYKAI